MARVGVCLSGSKVGQSCSPSSECSARASFFFHCGGMHLSSLCMQPYFNTSSSSSATSKANPGTALQLEVSATPNPSIEGTSYGLRPPAAPHVKR